MKPALRSSLALSALGLLASSRADANDSVQGTRSELLVESMHVVQMRLGRGHADLVVRRTVKNGGPRHDQAVFHLDVPSEGVATGLRTLGMKDGKPFWFAGELMEAEAAAAKYAELTGIGGYYPKDPALLSWRSQRELALQVFPVPPKEQKTVEYTLRLPTTYREGRDHVVLPALGTGALAADVVVEPADAHDGIAVGGKMLGRLAHLKVDGEIDVALARHAPPRFGGALAMVKFADERFLVRPRLEVAARLSEVPRGAAVVVLLDASRSLTDTEFRAEVAAARAYLSHFPAARAEVVTFDREAHARHGALVPVAEAIRDLELVPIQRANGSRVEEALAKARSLFAGLPTQIPRRVALFTDTLTREAFTMAALEGAAVGTKALVHIATLGLSSPSLQRDDEHPWAKAARATGGLFWGGGATDAPIDSGAMRATFEELARPLRIDRLHYEAPGLDADVLGFPESLAEGEGAQNLRINEKHVAYVKAEGEVWSSKIETVLLPDEREGTLWSALIFGQGTMNELSEPEMMFLAKRGGAVSPVTSYLAVEPGVRPSTEGLETTGNGIGLGGVGTIGHGSGTGSGSGFRGPDLAAMLRDAMRAGLAACGGAGKPAKLTLETTLRELVDVRGVSVDGATGALSRCLEQAAWDYALPTEFARSSITFELEL